VKDFKCDKCGEELDFDEVAYLAPDDPAAGERVECSPFTKLTCLCAKCAKSAGFDNRSPNL